MLIVIKHAIGRPYLNMLKFSFAQKQQVQTIMVSKSYQKPDGFQ